MLHILLALLLTAFSGSTTPTWYFGQLTDSGQLVAFTSEGTVRPFSIDGDVQFGARIDTQTALFILSRDDSDAHLYRITPEGADEISVRVNIDNFRQALTGDNAYVVLRDSTSPLPSQALLINVASLQAVTLTGTLPALARISQDGQFLHYMSTNGQTWSLIERTLATGDERVVHSFMMPSPLPPLSADRYGERWLVTTVDGNKSPIYNLLSADGTLTRLDGGTKDQPVAWSFFHDDLVGNPLRCGITCALEVRAGSSDTTFPLPAEGIYRPLAEPQPNTLLMLDENNDLWRLTANGAPLELGQYDPNRIFSTPLELISSVGRYVLAATGDTQYTVWDLTNGKPVIQLTGKFFGQIFYTAQGFTAHTYGDNSDDTALAYRTSDGQTIQLPHPRDGLYMDMLADGMLLYWLQTPDDAVGAPGIYRYDPAKQTYTVILANARLLVARPVS